MIDPKGLETIMNLQKFLFCFLMSNHRTKAVQCGLVSYCDISVQIHKENISLAYIFITNFVCFFTFEQHFRGLRFKVCGFMMQKRKKNAVTSHSSNNRHLFKHVLLLHDIYSSVSGFDPDLRVPQLLCLNRGCPTCPLVSGKSICTLLDSVSLSVSS